MKLATVSNMLIVTLLFLTAYVPVKGDFQSRGWYLPSLPLQPAAEILTRHAESAIWESLGMTDATYVKDDDATVPFYMPKPNYETDVMFRLYTRSEPSVGEMLIPEADKLSGTGLNPDVPTKIFIYGYSGFDHSLGGQILKENYLGYGDYNFIIVDWSNLNVLPYLPSREHTAGVANQTARLLNALDQSDLVPAKRQHIIGHSLGAQIAGMAGAAALKRPGRITGLDPAGPGFFLASDDGRLDPKDADLVDVIHTCASGAGYPAPVGHVDFYPNGGVLPQPDCDPHLRGGLFCAHCRSIHYFAYSIGHPDAFVGKKCQTFRIVRQICPDSSETAVMGDQLKFDSPGMYYLEATYPNASFFQTC